MGSYIVDPSHTCKIIRVYIPEIPEEFDNILVGDFCWMLRCVYPEASETELKNSTKLLEQGYEIYSNPENLLRYLVSETVWGIRNGLSEGLRRDYKTTLSRILKEVGRGEKELLEILKDKMDLVYLAGKMVGFMDSKKEHLIHLRVCRMSKHLSQILHTLELFEMLEHGNQREKMEVLRIGLSEINDKLHVGILSGKIASQQLRSERGLSV